jgi:hypothetical protein
MRGADVNCVCDGSAAGIPVPEEQLGGVGDGDGDDDDSDVSTAQGWWEVVHASGDSGESSSSGGGVAAWRAPAWLVELHTQLPWLWLEGHHPPEIQAALTSDEGHAEVCEDVASCVAGQHLGLVRRRFSSDNGYIEWLCLFVLPVIKCV